MNTGSNEKGTRMDMQKYMQKRVYLFMYICMCICVFAYADKGKVKANLQMRHNEF